MTNFNLTSTRNFQFVELKTELMGRIGLQIVSAPFFMLNAFWLLHRW